MLSARVSTHVKYYADNLFLVFLFVIIIIIIVIRMEELTE